MRGKDVVLESVSMSFGDFTAVHETTLTVKAGEFFTILGPSGCGKTTLLRIVSGFSEPTTGRVLIGGRDMTGIGPNRRPTALIFQNLALFPLMKVWENVAFGLEARGVGRRRRMEEADRLLQLVALDGQAHKRPGELSGGQRQRVAIARALAVEPAVLLLDEPLSALDLKLRQHMRAELKAIQRRTGVTFLYITHDQGEALAMSDRIAVMRHGVIDQVGTPDEIYRDPDTAFVATFVGEQNLFRGKLIETDGETAILDTPQGRFRGRNKDRIGVGEEAMMFVRPERVRIGDAGGDNGFTAAMRRRDLEGPFISLQFEAGGRSFTVHMTNETEAERDFSGEQRLSFRAADALILRVGELGRE